MKFRSLLAFLCALIVCAFFSSCAKTHTKLPPFRPSLKLKLKAIHGRVSAGPINGAKVQVFGVVPTGERGEALGEATTDSTGMYTAVLRKAYEGAMLVVASGGSYVEEASGASIEVGAHELMAFVSGSGDPARTVSITPLTQIASERIQKRIAANPALTLESEINAANAAVARAAGLAGVADITAWMPADPAHPLGEQGLEPGSKEARYALFLAAISKMAKDLGVHSLNITAAFAEDFKGDGAFDGTANGVPVSVKTDAGTGVAPLAGSDWSAGLLSAQSAYIASVENVAGFSSDSKAFPRNEPGADLEVLTQVTTLAATPKKFNALAVQGNDLFVAGGYAETGTGRRVLYLGRFDPSGAPDPAFHAGAPLFLALGLMTDAEIHAIAIQPDGRILLAGQANSTPFVARLLDDGSLDRGFGRNGIALSTVQGGKSIHALALQPDGRIVVAGYQLDASHHARYWIARYLSDGALDPGFGTAGVTTVNAATSAYGDADSRAYALALEQDGKILVAGNTDSASVVAIVRLTSSGVLDPAFASDGIAHDTTLRVARGIALASDGSILVSGKTTTQAAVARLTSAGALDTAFAGDGVAEAPAAMGAFAYGIHLLSDGKILVNGGAADFSITRFNADGSADATFNGDGDSDGVAVGFTTTGNGTTTFFEEWAYAMGVLSDGRIVLAGAKNDDAAANNHFQPTLELYRADGALDPAMDSDGRALSDQPGSADSGNEYGYAIAQQPDGKTLVVGVIETASRDALGTGATGPGPSSTNDWLILRYTQDGELDPSFGDSGKKIIDFGSDNDVAYAVAIQLNGKILVAGSAAVGGTVRLALARLNEDGSLDESFDGDSGSGNGLVTVAFNDHAIARSLVVQSDGKIVVGGETWSGGSSRFALARFDASGKLDPTFDGDGKAELAVGAADSSIQAIALDAYGRIVVTGRSKIGAAQVFTVARFTALGAPDPGFGTAGVQAFQVGIGDSYSQALALDSTGKILVGGEGTDGTTAKSFALARLTDSGALDSSFDQDGKLLSPVRALGAVITSGPAPRVVSLQLDPQGRILAGGYAGRGVDSSFDASVTLARYAPNGAIDSTFGTEGFRQLAPGGLAQARMEGMLLDPDGNLFIAGWATATLSQKTQAGSTDYDVMLMRYLSY